MSRSSSPRVTCRRARWRESPTSHELGCASGSMTISGLGTSARTQRRSTIACSSGACAGETGLAGGRLRRSVIVPPMPMAAAIAKAADDLQRREGDDRGGARQHDQRRAHGGEHHPGLEAAVGPEEVGPATSPHRAFEGTPTPSRARTCATDRLQVMRLLVLGGTVFLGRHVDRRGPAPRPRGHALPPRPPRRRPLPRGRARPRRSRRRPARLCEDARGTPPSTRAATSPPTSRAPARWTSATSSSSRAATSTPRGRPSRSTRTAPCGPRATTTAR